MLVGVRAELSQSVLIRSDLGSKLHALLRSAKAAFKIDGTNPAGRVGWSVIIMGVTEEITNPAELQRIEGLGLEPWAPGHKGHWIRIRSNTVSGRRIALVADKEPAIERSEPRPGEHLLDLHARYAPLASWVR